MRYIWTIFWAFLLSQMLVYVVGSMQGVAFNFMTGVLLSIVFSVAIVLLGDAGIPDEKH
jgi:hypothetical protein